MTEFIQGFPDGSVVKNLPRSAGETGNMGLIPGLGRSTGGGNGNPLQWAEVDFSSLKITQVEGPGRLQSQRVKTQLS